MHAVPYFEGSTNANNVAFRTEAARLNHCRISCSLIGASAPLGYDGNNGAWVKRTEAMQLIVQASPETIAICRAERSRLASVGTECEATFPLWKGGEIKYQDFMKKCKKIVPRYSFICQ